MVMTETEQAKAEVLGRRIYDLLTQREASFPVSALALAQAVLLTAKAASGRQALANTGGEHDEGESHYFRYLELWERDAQQWWYGEPQ